MAAETQLHSVAEEDEEDNVYVKGRKVKKGQDCEKGGRKKKRGGEKNTGEVEEKVDYLQMDSEKLRILNEIEEESF